jgi:hypothetical protein
MIQQRAVQAAGEQCPGHWKHALVARATAIPAPGVFSGPTL